MKRTILRTVLMTSAGRLEFSESVETPPNFEITDVHVSAKSANPSVKTGPVRGGRYEIKTATMVDLIRIAYDSTRTRYWPGRTGWRWIAST